MEPRSDQTVDPRDNGADGAASSPLGSDPLLSSFTEEPHAFWDRLRASRTIPLSRTNGDVYLPTSYADIRSIAEQPDVFSSRQIVAGPGAPALTLPFPPFTSDPPIHAVHRGFLAPLLSARRLDGFRAVADRAVEPVLRRLADQRCCEFVSEFSRPFVVEAIGHLIGVPRSEMGDYRAEALAYIRTSPADPARARPIDRRFRRLLLERIAEPCDDIASGLLSVRHHGRVLDDETSIAFLRVVLEAGAETTAGVISFAVKHFADGGHRATLGRSGFSWKRAVEEFIRAASPAVLARRSTAAAAVGGCPIEKDSAVLLCFAAANRDPDIFADPHEVKLDRGRNRHLAFGTGIHRCLGMHLARVLIETGVRRWTEAFPSYRLGDEGRLAWSVGSIRAIDRLPLVMEGGA